MKNSTLWIVSELYYPEETSTGYFITKIAEGLSNDRLVRVICSHPNYSERNINTPRREKMHGVDIFRAPASRFYKDNIIGRIVNILTFSISTLIYFSLKCRRGDTLLVVTNPPTLPPLLGWIARIKGARSILLVHDTYPEVLLATGHLREGGIAHRILATFFNRTYRMFTDVIVLGRDMADVARRKIESAPTRLQIIPNWGDIEEIEPIDRESNPFVDSLGLKNKTIIQFSGNLGRTHDLEMVLDVAESLAANDDIAFLIVGYGGKAQLIGERQSSGQLSNVIFLPRQPRHMLASMLACADATLIAFVDRMYGVSVPSRMYNVMAASVPIIAVAHPQSELAQVVTENECGWVVANGDRNALRALVLDITSDKGRIDSKKRGLAGRAAAVNDYTFSSVIGRFQALLDR